MNVVLFDVQTGFGGSAKGKPETVGVDALLDEMARLDIGRALVRTAPDELVNDAPTANEALYAGCQTHPSLTPCPILMPNAAYDMPSEDEQVAAAMGHGAGAAFLRPQLDYWSTADWASGALFRGLEARRLPAYCCDNQIGIEQVASLAERYPRLPFILTGVSYRSDRTLLPLLGTFPKTYLSIGSNYAVHKGIERLVAKVGAERILFGTGFPVVEAASAVAMLMYAEISDEEKQLIGSGNLERLIEGILR